MSCLPHPHPTRPHRHLAVLALLLAVTASAWGQVRNTPGTTSSQVSDFRSITAGANNGLGTNSQSFPRPADSIGADTSATKGLLFVEETPDSILRQKVFFFHYVLRRVKIDEVWNPSLDPTGIQYADMGDGFDGNYCLGMGTYGHPQQALFPVGASGLSHMLQSDGNATLLKTPTSLRLYQTLTPYTQLSYHNSLNKDYVVRVSHTQNIRPGWNAAFNYQLVCPEGNLSGSGAKNHHLDVSTNYFSPDSRLQVQAGFIWQSLRTDENGGLVDDSYFTNGQITNMAGLPVRLHNSSSRNLYHDAFARLTYNMVQQVETYRKRDSIAVRCDTVSLDSVLLVADTIELTDTITLRPPRMANLGVVGVEAYYSRWKRAAYLTDFVDSTLWTDASATLFWTNDAYPDHRWRNPLKVTIGITARRLGAILAVDTVAPPDTVSAFAVANPFAEAILSLGRASIDLKTELDNTPLGFSSKLHDPSYHASATASVFFDSAAHTGLQLVAAAQRELPELRMMHIMGYSLAPIVSQRYALRLFHSSDNGLFRLADLDIAATHMSHNVLYDSTLSVLVGDSDYWLAQARLTMRLQWRWLHLDMQQLLQHSTDETQQAVPLWASKNSLYADFTLFRNALRLQVGVDLRFFTAFTADAYDPATGLLYVQSVKTGDYLWGDAFVNMQVKRASIYLKAGHVNAVWERRPSYFLLPHYPGNRFALYWGITWNFFD